uniref:Uncharacterized protein n=1 Tax=Candidatus Kentrum sp. LFY TaxID=2126342 RepID=A0A450WQ72_9GAMM|nr:MAG: hypothetical protein BECKLFY1418C_GA0070996_10555 [Candidatus Kentron sp. LFY]
MWPEFVMQLLHLFSERNQGRFTETSDMNLAKLRWSFARMSGK